MRRAGCRHVPPGKDQHGDADRDVHEEDRPPGESGDVGVHDQAAQQLADRRRDAADRRIQADGTCPPVPVQGGLERCDHLRLAQRGRQSLGNARGDQHPDVGRDATQQGGDREADDTSDEQAMPADRVTQSPADHEHERVRRAVAGNHKLEHGRGRVQRGIHRGQGDVDDEKVEYRQESSAQQHDQADRAQCGGRSLRLGEHREVVDEHPGLTSPVHLRGHDDHHAPGLNLVPEPGYPGINANWQLAADGSTLRM
jgi:hypothetical protein